MGCCCVASTRITSLVLMVFCAYFRALEPVDKAIEFSGLDKESIQEILLIGGSTRIPQIQKSLEDHFGIYGSIFGQALPLCIHLLDSLWMYIPSHPSRRSSAVHQKN